MTADGPVIEPGCFDGVAVVVKRGREVVAKTTTDEDGRYRVKLADRRGRYRAVARKTSVGGTTCLPARSQRVRHTH